MNDLPSLADAQLSDSDDVTSNENDSPYDDVMMLSQRSIDDVDVEGRDELSGVLDNPERAPLAYKSTMQRE